jgi:hypothetical protein
VPQGSVLVPLFLVFINDIADGMTGLGRLFADDTSIGHIANDKDSLQDMVNLDLALFRRLFYKFINIFGPLTVITKNNT